MSEIEVFLIESACRNLVLEAAAHADANDSVAFSEAFTESAVLTRPNAQPLVGRAAIQQAYQQRPADRTTRHLVTNTRVAVESPSAAKATSYVLLWSGETSQPIGPFGHAAQNRQLVGEFEDRFAHTEQGWKISERIARFVLHTAP